MTEPADASQGHHGRAMLERDRVFVRLGMRLDVDEPGRAVLTMPLRDDMMNGFDIAHGGIVFTLADTAFALACNEDEHVTVAAGCDIVFLKGTTVGQTLTATATKRAHTGRNGVYDVTVTDETGDVVAEFRGRSFTTNRTLGAPKEGR